ncbi:MAG: family 43 glycosylhydrolase [Candidatus Hinthialibacter antarcticus]|nr:family 43 glycosylhydrolase [Candidatus Hinthialibacter antarcticus]
MFKLRIIFTCVFCAMFAVNSYSAEPRMKFADDTYGAPKTKDPVVVRFDGRYLMYYTLFSPNGVTIGVAESNNLNDWKRIGEIKPAADYEAKGICAPGALVKDGKVHLFYQRYGYGAQDAICHAVSSDGLQFERDASNPIFHPTGKWNNGRAIDAEVFPFNDKLFLYFATRDPEGKVQKLGVATAPLDSDYSRDQWTQQCDDSILEPTLDWEMNCIEAPTLVQRGDRLYMFYAGAYNNDPQQVGVAASEDGLLWKRIFDKPFLTNGKPGEWNESESGHPCIFADEDGRTHLFFQGNNDGGKTWYLSNVEVFWNTTQPMPTLNTPSQPE